MKKSIALLPGDGIGPEVCESAVKLLHFISEKFNLSFSLTEKSIGGSSYEKFGTPLTEETLQTCYDSDIVLLGAVGGPQWDDLPNHLKPESALLKLRKSLGLFTNIRPAKVFSSMLASSSLKEEVLQGTDFVVFRELTGGIYFGEPRGYNDNKGFNTMIYTRKEVEQISRRAFKAAAERKGPLTLVDKANVLECSQFWRKIVAEVHEEYSDVELNYMYVDNAAMQIVKNPRQFNVILTSNLFGDILSDIAGMITGSLGMLPSASLGSSYALYEPVHGSAPDIAGEGTANPIAMLCSVAMMLEYSLEMNQASDLIYKAIDNVLNQGYRTADIFTDGMKKVSTTEITNIIINEIEEVCNQEAIGLFLL
jgi:3-isopropylmalate dehydrogenase